MSLLTLVRHGQASYMAEDYDRLSQLGELQARKLAQFWLRHRISFDRVYCGPTRRHRGTEEIVRQEFAFAGVPWPKAETLTEIDEFDAFQVAKSITPLLVQRDERVWELNRQFRENQDSPEAGRLLQRLFEEVARHWSSGEFAVNGVETWAEFRARVQNAMTQIRNEAAKSSSIVAFTSGGPIAATVSLALDLPPQKAIEFVWLSRNSSYSEFLFTGDRFSLSSFNSFPHLDDRELLTYR